MLYKVQFMKCNDIDFITRNGHSDVFKHEVESIFESIDLRISGTPKLTSYGAISVSDFRRDNSWYRIPCESRKVYCKKINNFWKDKYEIAYRTRLSLYGNKYKLSYYRVLRIEYDNAVHIDPCQEALREEVNRLRRELLNIERTIRL